MRSWIHAAWLLTIIALAALAPDAARADVDPNASSGYFVTIAARWCTSYDQITANVARNNIQESLKDLGQNSPYGGEDSVVPATEAATQPQCKPLPGWQFTLGRGIGPKSVGPWGSLSDVTGAMPAAVSNTTPIVTRESVPDPGTPGSTLLGATTIELTNEQKDLAAQTSRLWIQGGVPGDPVLDGVLDLAGKYALGALRCSYDNQNGDNVEWIAYKSASTHTYCFAYYMTPPPDSATV